MFQYKSTCIKVINNQHRFCFNNFDLNLFFFLFKLNDHYVASFAKKLNSVFLKKKTSVSLLNLFHLRKESLNKTLLKRFVLNRWFGRSSLQSLYNTKKKTRTIDGLFYKDIRRKKYTAYLIIHKVTSPPFLDFSMTIISAWIFAWNSTVNYFAILSIFQSVFQHQSLLSILTKTAHHISVMNEISTHSASSASEMRKMVKGETEVYIITS